MAVEDLKTNAASHRGFGRKKQLERDLEHITQEMYQRNKELNDTNRTLSLLRTIDTLVLESHDDIKALSDRVASSVTYTTEYPMVAIFGPSSLHTPQLELYGLSVSSDTELDKDLLKDIKPTTKHQWFKNPHRTHLVSLAKKTPKDIMYYLGCSQETADRLLKGPIKTVYFTKLIARQQIVGVMAIGSTGPLSSFTASDLSLLDRLSEAVGIALDSRLLFEENQRVLTQLKKANVRLRDLDQTKDEFISMASHQLRTPLTTIKGYLSMVLDGGGGPLTKNEREMIQTAYASAEQMVFLIADLLNVSRLQSGKFIIENKPTDLVKMIKTEVNQLKETAEQHKLTLTCTTPDNLPLLYLDDTKIRQVIMNFLDNAIYYTPAGGSISVNLEATDSAISYTVTDTGLGVPKSEQHHLFTKFFRAGNARKMRPDGTGLGLFMAKKVIVAQGGATIFKSTEGKGSTFGFTFPRAKLEAPKTTDD